MNGRVPLFFVMLAVMGVATFLISFVVRNVDSNSLLGFMSVIAKISATFLGMFIAGFLFLLGSSTDVREAVSIGDLIASFVLFSLAILHSLISMLTIIRDTSVDLLVPTSWILYIAPLCWMIGAIFVLSILVWNLYVEKI